MIVRQTQLYKYQHINIINILKMRAIVDRYSKYLATLAKPELTAELHSLHLQPPSVYSKQGYIEALTTSSSKGIQQRLQQLELGSKGKQNKQSKSQLQAVLTAEHRKVQQILFSIQSQIYRDMTTIYESSQSSAQDISSSQQGKQQMGSVFDIKDLDLSISRTQFMNVLLNAQQEIKLHPSKVQFEHQRGLSELLDSFVTYRTEDYLDKKERELFKKMLPRDTPVRGHCIENILALYGVKKEEEFLSDLQDPLETILTENKISHKNKHLLLHSFLTKLESRGNYYESIVNSFDFHELHGFVQTMQGITELPHISEFAGKVAVLKVARLIRQNQRHFNNAYYRSLLSLAEEGGKLSSLNSHQAKLDIGEEMFSIEGWIVDAIQAFRLLVQSLVISKEDQLQFMNNVLLYKRLKEQIRTDLLQQLGESHKEESIAALNNELQPYLQTEGADLSSVLASAEPDQFNQKIFQIVLFFSTVLTEHTMVRHFTLYSYILDYYVNLEPIKLPVQIFQKIVRDSTAILEKMATMRHLDILDDRRVNEAYVNHLIEFIFRSSEQVEKHTLGRNLKLIWKMYSQVHADILEMSAEQGRYFIMFTSLGTNLGRDSPAIKGSIIMSEQYLPLLKRYLRMLESDQDHKVDKQVIFDMLKEEVMPLFTLNQLRMDQL